MSAKLVQARNLEVHEVPDGYIVYQADQDRVHYLNKTAAIIFEFCNGSFDEDAVVARVAQIFDLGASTHDEIRGGLSMLMKEGLILSISTS
jgi:coenzyme PQQ synthesis protein D (PqqD)